MTAKICFIYPHSIPSEKNRVIYQRLKILSSYYFVVLFTVDKYHIPVELEKMMKVMRMPCSVSHNILRKVIVKVIFPIWCVALALRIYRKEKYDAIVTAHVLDHFIGFILKICTGRKWIVDAIHLPYRHQDLGMINRDPLLYFRGLKSVFTAKIILRFADFALVVAHSKEEGYAKIFIQKFSIKKDRIMPAPGGVDLDLINEFRKQFRREKEGEKSAFRIFYVGAISGNKAHELVDCIGFVKDKIPNVKLILAGPIQENFQEELISKVNSLGVTKEVVITGRLAHSDVLKAIELADICVNCMNASTRDYQYAHPQKLFEYMAFGKPIVATDSEGTRGIIRDGYSGLLYENGNVVDLAEKIQMIYNDKKLGKKLSKNAQKSVRDFDWNKINQRWFKALDELIQ
jgi:glycosyltransferase involved in cell wall biosynthesis